MQEDILPLFFDFFNPWNVIRYGGLLLLVSIIFAESGIFFCFFLPGDSLLFTAGLLANTEYLPVAVYILIPVLVIAAVAGSVVGYFTGKWAGHYLPTGNDRFFKKRHMDMTEDFYNRHGMLAFIFGKFLPVIRTFVTILAGLVQIDFRKFLMYNVLGASIWIATMTLAGHWLGRAFPGIVDYLEIIVVLMIVISAIPAITIWLRDRAKNSNPSR